MDRGTSKQRRLSALADNVDWAPVRPRETLLQFRCIPQCVFIMLIASQVFIIKHTFIVVLKAEEKRF